jgi:MFS family permease
MSDGNRKRGLLGFFGGVICTQFVNSALHLAQPLLISDLTGSLGHAALFSSFDTAVHMGGTFLGGWPVDRFGARRVLVWSTALRGAALAAIPLSMWAGTPTVAFAMAWYTVDAFVRGFSDSASYTLPLEFAAHEKDALDRLNSRFEISFDLGGIAGPLLLGALMLYFRGIVAHAIIPLGFLLSAALFALIPAVDRAAPAARTTPAEAMPRGGSWQGLKTIFASRALFVASLGYMSFNIYPLRKLLASLFAKAILRQKAAAGFVGAAFGLGGLLGAIFYDRKRGGAAPWVLAGAGGMLLLAGGWIPGSLAIMCLAAFGFAFTNVGARLALARQRQELTPLTEMGGVTAISRFGANLISVLSKAAVGAAFSLGSGAISAFGIVGGVLAVIGGGQFLFGWLLKPAPLPVDEGD